MELVYAEIITDGLLITQL